MTYVVGSIFVHESPAAMSAGFPVDLLLLLVGVTWLFAIAEANGTVERIVQGAASLVQHRGSLIPWIVFVVASLPAMAGALVPPASPCSHPSHCASPGATRSTAA